MFYLWTDGGCRRENWMSYGHHYYYSSELHSRQRLTRDEAVVSIIQCITKLQHGLQQTLVLLLI